MKKKIICKYNFNVLFYSRLCQNLLKNFVTTLCLCMQRCMFRQAIACRTIGGGAKELHLLTR